MEQRISLITLGVADLARATGFYERLGWRRSVKGAEGVAFFQAGAMVLSLYPREDLEKDAGVPLATERRPPMALAYNTRTREEVDAVLSEAVDAGATLIHPARDAHWGGYFGHFADPDGFLWEVAWNPGFPMTDDGVLTLPE